MEKPDLDFLSDMLRDSRDAVPSAPPELRNQLLQMATHEAIRATSRKTFWFGLWSVFVGVAGLAGMLIAILASLHGTAGDASTASLLTQLSGGQNLVLWIADAGVSLSTLSEHLAQFLALVLPWCAIGFLAAFIFPLINRFSRKVS